MKKKISFNDCFEFGMYGLALICFVYFFMKKIPSKMLEPVLIVVVLFGIRLLVKYLKVKMFFALRFSILFFIFVTMFLANEFGFYTLIPMLDKAEHLLSGVVLFFVGFLIFNRSTRHVDEKLLPFTTKIWFSLFFSIAMAACWEIYEFTTDPLFGLHSQNNSLLDTMWDIICGTIGATIASLYVYFSKRAKNRTSQNK